MALPGPVHFAPDPASGSLPRGWPRDAWFRAACWVPAPAGPCPAPLLPSPDHLAWDSPRIPIQRPSLALGRAWIWTLSPFFSPTFGAQTMCKALCSCQTQGLDPR